MQPYSGEVNLELHYMDTESFISSFKPFKGIIENLKRFKVVLYFIHMDPTQDFSSEKNKEGIGKKMETAPGLDTFEAIFLRSKSRSINIKQNSSHCAHKTVQYHIKYTLEDLKYCSEIEEIKYDVEYSLGSNKHEFSMVKRKKIASNTFDGKRCFSDKYKSVPWAYNPSS